MPTIALTVAAAAVSATPGPEAQLRVLEEVHDAVVQSKGWRNTLCVRSCMSPKLKPSTVIDVAPEITALMWAVYEATGESNENIPTVVAQCS